MCEKQRSERAHNQAQQAHEIIILTEHEGLFGRFKLSDVPDQAQK